MRVIAVINQKGGVGKTSLTFNLGFGIRDRRHRVLLVDLDSQGSLTRLCGVEAEKDRTIYQVLHGVLGTRDVLVPVDKDLYLVPATVDLAGAEIELSDELEREYRLRDALKEVKFDYVLIDCPPSLGLLTVNALMAARWALVPVATQLSSIYGLELLMRTVKMLKAKGNKGLSVLGVVPTMFDRRTRHSHEVLDLLFSLQSLRVFTPIPHSVRMQEIFVIHRPVFEYMPGADVSLKCKRLVREVLDETSKPQRG